MTNQETKLQAYLDGELPAQEAAEVKAWLAQDKEAQLLLTELQNTSAALAGHEAGVKLPESREFFWSKIEREIAREQRASAIPERATPWFAGWRRYFLPLSGVAALTASLLFMVGHFGATNAAQFGEIELASDDMGAYTFRDQEQKMTMVWLYDRTADSQFTEESPFANVESQQ